MSKPSQANTILSAIDCCLESVQRKVVRFSISESSPTVVVVFFLPPKAYVPSLQSYTFRLSSSAEVTHRSPVSSKHKEVNGRRLTSNDFVTLKLDSKVDVSARGSIRRKWAKSPQKVRIYNLAHRKFFKRRPPKFMTPDYLHSKQVDFKRHDKAKE